jgi:XTP/dITP diphosphohydrolase
MDLVVATRSADKMREIRRILAGVPRLRVLDLDEAGVAYDAAEEELEPWETFEENARSKAVWFAAKTGRPTVADDSGLEVDALGGAPGVRSKRFAGGEGLDGTRRDEANNRHLLDLLGGRPEEERGARYVCVAVLVEGGRDPLVCRGEAAGRILEAPRGDGGFGYDPLFFDPELGRAFAEITRDEKNARSHRGAAFRALAARLKERG